MQEPAFFFFFFCMGLLAPQLCDINTFATKTQPSPSNYIFSLRFWLQQLIQLEL